MAELLQQLNTQRKFSTALHPDQVARALLQCDKNRLLATREQQDAQEFFSLLIDTLESESARQWLVVNKTPGLETVNALDESPGISVKTMSTLDTHIPSPFEGLSAHRMGCLKCKYVENIRHEKFGPMVLPLNMQRSTTLEECLREEFEMETLEDVECQKCTLLAYREGLARILAVDPTIADAKTVADAKSRLDAINMALASGKIEEPMPETKKFIRRSTKTKAYMIARPPSLLAFHIQRSSFHNYTGRALKNQAPVSFPLTLDMSEYVTTPTLSMDPEEPISLWQEGDARTIYRLRSVIVHYGLHHMGHYVAYRRAEAGWFRISDEDVEYVPFETTHCRSTSVEDVLAEGARGVFMLMYELVHSAGMEEWLREREESIARTIDTMDTVPNTVKMTPVSVAIPTVLENFSPVTAVDIDESDIETPPSPSTVPPRHEITSSDGQSLLDIVEAQLDDVHISPASSVASHSTDDSLVHIEHPTRSTSFSSIHSRPQTPIFEFQDPQVSPPPMKRMKRETTGETEAEVEDFLLQGDNSVLQG